MLSKSDHKKRSKGVGSSEIAMLIYTEDGNGDMKPLSPWGGRHKLWEKKTGRSPTAVVKSYMTRGQYMEAGLLSWYADDHKVAWVKPKTARHEKYHYVVDSCDGLTFPDGTKAKAMNEYIGGKSKTIRPLRCLEAKTSTGWKRDEWGEPGTDEVPDYYNVQGQWHMGLWLPEEMICDFPVDDGSQRKDYTVPFDEELYLALISETEKFWMDYVEKDVEPPVDDYSDTVQWLSKYLTHKKDSGLLDADDETVKLMLQYRDVALQIKDGETGLAELKEKLMRIIGEHDGIIITGTKQKILWKRSKDSNRVHWQSIAEQLAKDLKLAASDFTSLQSTHTNVQEGSRRWTPTSLLKQPSH